MAMNEGRSSKCEAAFDSDLILSLVFWETSLSKALPYMQCKALLSKVVFSSLFESTSFLVEKIDSLHKFEGTLFVGLHANLSPF
jgi:hypothetical protein